MPPLFLSEFGTVVGKRCPTRLGDRQSLSGPGPFRYARVVALHDISCASELIQFAVLVATAGRNGEHQKCPAMLLDALQHRDESRGQLQITHEGVFEMVLSYDLNICVTKARKSILMRKP
jgi:hypothetical protein